ncbi:MAG: DNA mismatch repair protein MutS [Rickettsiales bacterium]|jgi:DNA mismatch repair protein MutS|nr:DNA mismatch repair protein MutS [Rickettsiales bacterium]
MAELSPIMQQYVGMKQQVPDALLLFRIGDFFEAFFNDAKIISGAIDLVLTKRGTTPDGKGIPMCGIPAHALDSYMGKLVKLGYHVALADQMESPDEAKARGAKQMRREVVRVVTPGTLTDESLLKARSQNLLMAIVKSGDSDRVIKCSGWGQETPPRDGEMEWWVAACDISTGEFLVGETNFNLIDAVAKANPAEIIMPEFLSEDETALRIKKSWPLHFIHKNVAVRSDINEIRESVFGARGTHNPAVDLLAVYLNQTQRGAALVFQAPKSFNSGSVMSIDQSSFESLEIDKSIRADGAALLDVIDKTKTAMGGRRLKQLLREPSTDLQEIARRQNNIEILLKNKSALGEVQALLNGTPDIARSLTRLVSGRGMPRDLVATRNFIISVSGFKAAALRLGDDMKSKFVALSDFYELGDILTRGINEEVPAFFRDGGTIRAGYNAALDRLRSLGGDAKKVAMSLQEEYAKQTGVANLRVKFNNVIGYFVETTAKNADPLMRPGSGFIHRQSVANYLRFTTEQLANLDSEIRTATDKANALEQETIAEIIAKVAAESQAIIDAQNLIAELDVWAGLAEAADEFYWTRPSVVAEPVLDIRGGRHPVVEKIMRAKALQFVANDCELGNSGDKVSAEPTDITTTPPLRGTPSPAKGNIERGTQAKGAINIITGPNMAGKSTYLRQNALIIILAHLGSFVPAQSAVIGLVDKLFSRVGASDNLAQGQSTFMVEMSETANILRNATERSFVILDEIGRGTATWDGMAIAQATLEFLDGVRPRTLFATHYHELTDLRLSAVKNSTMQVKESDGEIAFMYKVVFEAVGKSYGIHVAKLAGMPESVVRRAEEILGGLEGKGANHPVRLRFATARHPATLGGELTPTPDAHKSASPRPSRGQGNSAEQKGQGIGTQPGLFD